MKTTYRDLETYRKWTQQKPPKAEINRPKIITIALVIVGVVYLLMHAMP